MNMTIPEAIEVLRNFKLDMSQPDAFRMVRAIEMAEEALKKQLESKDTDVLHNDGWIPVKERLPETDDYILLSFSNFSLPMVGRYEEDSGGGAFYLGDCDEEDTCISQDLFVNAWMPLPEPYQDGREDV